MAQTRLYPVVVEDLFPFCIFIVAFTKAQAKAILENKFDWIKGCEEVSFLPPIVTNPGTTFAVDVEMSILHSSDEMLAWLCVGEDGYCLDGFKLEKGDGEKDDGKSDKKDKSASSESTKEKSTDEPDYIWV